jgi:glycerol-3-phosphate dehydrogenase (NAD(P)+)
MNTKAVAVIGGGPWGVALASAASRNAPTYLISRRPPDRALPKELRVVKDMDVLKEVRLVILAAPSQVAREVLRSAGDHLSGAHYIVHGVRGLVGSSMQTVSELVHEETPVHRVGALGGPILVDELLAEKPGVLVAGSRFPEVNESVSAALGSKGLRVYPTPDLLGLEWASALVGCLAIAIGFAEALKTGPGLLAALICRSMGEAARIAAAAGGDERTLLGLAGYGDLLAAIEQSERPEVLLGRSLAEGRSMVEARESAGQRIEAIDLVPRVGAWAKEHGVRAPIFSALARGIAGHSKPEQILAELMTLPLAEGA